MALVKSVIHGIEDFDYNRLNDEAAAAQVKIVEAGVRVDEDFCLQQCSNLGKKFVIEVIKNMKERFSDDICQLSSLQKILKDKPECPDLQPVADLIHLPVQDLIDEWKFLRRLEVDLSCQETMIEFATMSDKKTMFPSFSSAFKLLLLPLGTATVERSFSTSNRILTSERCRLLPNHVRQLMLVSVEGPPIPDLRDGTEADEFQLQSLVNRAYTSWLEKPRRFHT